MAQLTFEQRETVNQVAYECAANADVNAIVRQLIDKNVLPTCYANVMGANTVSHTLYAMSSIYLLLQPALRTNTMLEVGNCVCKKGIGAYVALYESISFVNGVNCAAAAKLAQHLPNTHPMHNNHQQYNDGYTGAVVNGHLRNGIPSSNNNNNKLVNGKMPKMNTVV
jgi:hypothetical protein